MRGLKEQLWALSDPTTEVEDWNDAVDALGDGAVLANADDEEHAPPASKAPRKVPEKARLRADISLDEGVYACKRTSTAKLFPASSPSPSSSDAPSVGAGTSSGDGNDGVCSSLEKEHEQGESLVSAGGGSRANSQSGQDHSLDDRICRRNGVQMDGNGGGSGTEASGGEDSGPEASDIGEERLHSVDNVNGSDASDEVAADAEMAGLVEEYARLQAQDRRTFVAATMPGTHGLVQNQVCPLSHSNDITPSYRPLNKLHAVDAEMAELEEEYARLQAQDRSASASVAAQAHDVAKARAVQNQARIWEQALGIRIAIQKPLASADRLPGAAAKRAAAEAAPGLEAAYGRARHACAAALATTLAAVDELLARQKEEETPEGKRTQERGGRKHDRSCSGDSSLEELWGDVEAASARLAPLRDASVDRWQRKTLLATGRAALRGEMRALNQSLSQQVAALLAEPGRAIERVQRRPEAAVQVLCEVGVAGSGPATFDDTAFYQVLLQELLESADAGVAYGAAVQANKKRKEVDRRASKGRKIRYTVIDKLVNFMVPVEMQDDSRVASLFSNLFGHGLEAGGQVPAAS